MSPDFQRLNHAHEAAAHGVSGGDLLIGSRRRSNFKNQSLIQFGTGVLFAPPIACSSATLGGLVGIVIRHSSKKEVLRIDARRIVASVTDTEALWNRPKVNQPRGSMCQLDMVRVPSRKRVTDFPVALPCFESRPCPASFSLGDLRPESSGKGFGSDRIGVSHDDLLRSFVVRVSVEARTSPMPEFYYTSAAHIRRRGLDAFQALDAIKSEPRQWRVPDLLELRAALAQGIDAYQQRYFALTAWTV